MSDLAIMWSEERFADLLEATAKATEPAELLWRHRTLARTGDVDEALLAVRRLLAAGPLPAPLAVEAHALVVELYGARRAAPLVARAHAAAVEAVGDVPAVAFARALAHHAADERVEARELLARVVKEERTGRRTVAHAQVLYVLGNFADATAELAHVPNGDEAELAALRLRAQIEGAQGKWESEAEVLAELVARGAKSDYHVHDRVSLAMTLATRDRLEGAREQFRWLADNARAQHIARYARARLGFLDASGEGAKRCVLKAFPTTHQKRNHCGPAVIELCARYLGLDLDQDKIAAEVKRETGTPMYEITRFLSAQGIVHRRVVVDDPKVKAAIDLGFPVILQEEYSTTSHVAVITGYDDRLGVFVVTDPMTHRSGTRPYGWNEKAGELFGCGVVVVLGRRTEGGDETEVEAKATAAGLVDAAHLRLLDDADRKRPHGLGGESSGSVHELVDIATKAIAAQEDFRLAWLRRVNARLELYRRSNADAARDDFLADLYEVRTRFPNDEWPHQVHARYLDWEGRSNEAAALYADALRIDPGDGNNSQSMGAMKFFGGDLAGAEKNLWRALRDYAYPGAAESLLAGVYLRELELRLEEDKKPAPIPWAVSRFPEKARTRIGKPLAELSFAAEHMSELACAFAPNDATNWDVAGFLALARRDAKAAVEPFEKAVKQRARAARGLACALEHLGDRTRAEQLLRDVAKQYPRHTESQTDLASFLRRGDQAEKAAAHLEAVLDQVTAPEDVVHPLYDALRIASSSEEACARLRELALPRQGKWAFLMAAVDKLENAAWGGHACALLRALVAKAPKDVALLTRLGRLLLPSPFTAGEARELLERAVALDDQYYWATRSLALAHVRVDPSAGLATIERALGSAANGPQIGYALEVKRLLLRAAGRDDEAEATYRKAIGCWESNEKGLRAITYFHLDQTEDYEAARELSARALPIDDAVEGSRWAHCYYLRAHRLTGRARDVAAHSRTLWDAKPELRSDLGWDVFWAMRDVDRTLAGEAARLLAETAETRESRVDWDFKAATMEALLGDATRFDALEDTARAAAKERPKDLSKFYWVQAELKRWERALSVADAAYEASPTDAGAATAMCEAASVRGDAAAARKVAEKLIQDRPYAHAGFERLALVAGAELDAKTALDASAKALESAPTCSVAHRSRALALFAAGDVDAARAHAKRAVQLDVPNAAAEERWPVAFLAALDGDAKAMDAYLATLGPDEAERKAPYLAKLRERVTGS